MSRDTEDLAEMVDGFVALAKRARKAERESIIKWLRGTHAFNEYGMEAMWIAAALEAHEDQPPTLVLERP